MQPKMVKEERLKRKSGAKESSTKGPTDFIEKKAAKKEKI
jgi:hypothetical protein